MTEISIGNDRMVDEHHKRQENADAINWEVARFGRRRRRNLRGRP